MTDRLRVFIGWDASQMRAWNVAQWSLLLEARGHAPEPQRLSMNELQASGLYTRPTARRDGRLWDVVSDAPMATGHAIARFFVPMLCEYDGWAVFTDGDVLFRRDVADLFALAEPGYAVQVVKHDYAPTHDHKMDGQAQTRYPRKNWSSVVLWNCAHAAHRRLTTAMLNTVPGRDLHAFCWLTDDEIGPLPLAWNWLVGHSPIDMNPALVHFTEGLPDQPGYADVPYAAAWWKIARYAGYHAAEADLTSHAAAAD